MSSFLDLTDERMEDAVEPKAVDEGEYTVKIIDWKTTETGEVTKMDINDEPFIMPVLEIIECEEAEYAKTITHFLRLPHAGMNKKDRNSAIWALKEFFTAFDVDYTQKIDYEDCIGKTAESLLTVTPDTGYGEQNRIQKLINPK